MSLKIIIADDHQIIREGLKNLLSRNPEIEIIAEAENGRESVTLALSLIPDLVIMDVSMPELNGIEATRLILKRYPEIKIIALTIHSEKQFVVEMLKAGASAYLLKDCAFKELSQALQTVLENKIYISPSIANIVIDSIQPEQETGNPFFILTEREREILQLLTEGKSTKETAQYLSVSPKTIETYRHQIMNKLKIYNIAELTKYAIREGITSII
jgi:two-component system, NarL family, response regulator NreC